MFHDALQTHTGKSILVAGGGLACDKPNEEWRSCCIVTLGIVACDSLTYHLVALGPAIAVLAKVARIADPVLGHAGDVADLCLVHRRNRSPVKQEIL